DRVCRQRRGRFHIVIPGKLVARSAEPELPGRAFPAFGHGECRVPGWARGNARPRLDCERPGPELPLHVTSRPHGGEAPGLRHRWEPERSDETGRTLRPELSLYSRGATPRALATSHTEDARGVAHAAKRRRRS